MIVEKKPMVDRYPCWGGLLPLQEELLCPRLSSVHPPSVLPASPSTAVRSTHCRFDPLGFSRHSVRALEGSVRDAT